MGFKTKDPWIQSYSDVKQSFKSKEEKNRSAVNLGLSKAWFSNRN